MTPEWGVVYAIIALLAFREFMGSVRDGRFYRNTVDTLKQAIDGIGAQWDRDRVEMRDRQDKLYEQLVLKTEQLEDALVLLADLSKTPLKKARARPQAIQHGVDLAGQRMLNGVARADAVRSPESVMG